VDEVTIFDDPSVLHVVEQILQDILVKGGHCTLDQIVGRDEVEVAVGQLDPSPNVPGYSTTASIEAAQGAGDNKRLGTAHSNIRLKAAPGLLHDLVMIFDCSRALLARRPCCRCRRREWC
jgi:hypothetical protein